jgi:hypothetical protein
MFMLELMEEVILVYLLRKVVCFVLFYHMEIFLGHIAPYCAFGVIRKLSMSSDAQRWVVMFNRPTLQDSLKQPMPHAIRTSVVSINEAIAGTPLPSVKAWPCQVLT